MFFKKPGKWLTIDKDNFSDKHPYTKTDAKRLLGIFLEHCGFDEEYITEEQQNFSESMNEEVYDLRESLDFEKEDLAELKTELSVLKKTGKNESGLILTGGKLKEAIQDMKEEIESKNIDIEVFKLELKTLKADWKLYLIRYINDVAVEKNT